MIHRESATQRFRALLEEAKPPTGGVAYEDLASEALPLLPLLSELRPADLAEEDYEGFGFRECFAVLTLLGRRLALLDLTPTATIQSVLLAIRSVEALERSSSEFALRAVAAAMEGFVLGREERVAQTAESSARKPLRPLRIDDAVFALILSGVHEAGVLSECVDALGRAMLKADVELAIVDLSQLGEPNRDRAIAMFAADEITQMLGGVCFFTGVDSRWRAAAEEAQIALDTLRVTPDLATALQDTRRMAEQRADRTKPRWRALLDRFRP